MENTPTMPRRVQLEIGMDRTKKIVEKTPSGKEPPLEEGDAKYFIMGLRRTRSWESYGANVRAVKFLDWSKITSEELNSITRIDQLTFPEIWIGIYFHPNATEITKGLALVRLGRVKIGIEDGTKRIEKDRSFDPLKKEAAERLSYARAHKFGMKAAEKILEEAYKFDNSQLEIFITLLKDKGYFLSEQEAWNCLRTARRI